MRRSGSAVLDFPPLYHPCANVNRRKPEPTESFGEEAWDVIPAMDARPILPKAAFFLGDLRDGLPMVSYETLDGAQYCCLNLWCSLVAPLNFLTGTTTVYS
jgi:hypothetical protein